MSFLSKKSTCQFDIDKLDDEKEKAFCNTNWRIRWHCATEIVSNISTLYIENARFRKTRVLNMLSELRKKIQMCGALWTTALIYRCITSEIESSLCLNLTDDMNFSLIFNHLWFFFISFFFFQISNFVNSHFKQKFYTICVNKMCKQTV